MECLCFLKDNIKTIIHQIYDARGSNKAKNKAGSRKWDDKEATAEKKTYGGVEREE